ncbi:MAG: hypothetical protein K8S20_14795 [Chloroflexi bacterium]|nr:hypothetical protein [Chloroflexota bacterium]
MKNRRFVYFAFALLLIISCNLPAAGAQEVKQPEVASPTSNSVTDTPVAATQAGSTVPLAAPNSGALNCRSGPGTVWPVVMILNPGQTAEIVGRSADGTWLYVKNISLPGSFCWVSASYVTVSGDINSLAVVPAPPLPPTSAVPAGPSSGVVTSVEIYINPDTINVGGCMGPIQPVTISADITVNGPVKLTWHFEDQQTGAFTDHSVTFKGAGTKSVSDSFTPPVNDGKYRIELYIDGMNLKGMNAVGFYKINC